MEINCSSLLEFKNFVENGHANNGLEEPQLMYGLFMKLGEENYQNGSLLKVASEFIELLRKKLDDEGKHKGGNPFQQACITHLLEEAQLEKDETREKITSHLEQLSQRVCKNIYLKLMGETGKVVSVATGNELISFLQLFKEHINIYNEKLLELSRKYKGCKRTILLYAFQQIGAVQGFTITRHLFKNIESVDGSYYLFSPSHAHYLINPTETIFLLVRTSLGGGGHLSRNQKRAK